MQPHYKIGDVVVLKEETLEDGTNVYIELPELTATIVDTKLAAGELSDEELAMIDMVDEFYKIKYTPESERIYQKLVGMSLDAWLEHMFLPGQSVPDYPFGDSDIVRKVG